MKMGQNSVRAAELPWRAGNGLIEEILTPS